MRPVYADAVANLAAKQFITGHAHEFRLGIQQRVFDRAHGERDDTARRRACHGIELGKIRSCWKTFCPTTRADSR